MKNILLIAISTLLLHGCDSNPNNSNKNIITSDIDNFWIAYDEITTTKDTIEQAIFLKKLYLNKGTKGLKSMIKARNYSEQEFLYSINNYSKFWSSIRNETYKAKTLSKELELGIEKLNFLYPELKPAKIYFIIGALRSNGTTLDSLVLIGSELAFANKNTPTEEFPDYLSHLRSFF